MKKEIKNFIRLWVSLIIVYIIFAYIILPYTWQEHYANQNKFNHPMITSTKMGAPGDPINIIILGSRIDLINTMHAAGWYVADPVTIQSYLDIIGSVLLDFSDKNAPISLLYYDGRPQDLAFEKPDGSNAVKRHHVRFWLILNDSNKRWVGSATFDRSIELSHYTAQVTHQIAPNIDSERDYLIDNLINTGMVSEIHQVKGIGSTQKGYNGEGNLYYTDGKAIIVKLRSMDKNQKINL